MNNKEFLNSNFESILKSEFSLEIENSKLEIQNLEDFANSPSMTLVISNLTLVITKSGGFC